MKLVTVAAVVAVVVDDFSRGSPSRGGTTAGADDCCCCCRRCGSDGSRTVRKSHRTTVSFMYRKARSLNRPLGIARARLCLAITWISVVPAITVSFQRALTRCSSWTAQFLSVQQRMHSPPVQSLRAARKHLRHLSFVGVLPFPAGAVAAEGDDSSPFSSSSLASLSSSFIGRSSSSSSLRVFRENDIIAGIDLLMMESIAANRFPLVVDN